MANDEKIYCDYDGCGKLFAYRIRGFNLCAEHCGVRDGMKEIVRDLLKRDKARRAADGGGK